MDTSKFGKENAPDIGLIVSTSGGLNIDDKESGFIHLIHHIPKE